MYLPQHVAEPDVQTLHRIVRDNALGILMRPTKDGFEADHLPFLLQPAPEGPGTLIAHVARANPVWREMDNGSTVLVVFRGAEGYISPNWYPGKHETHRRVPTWNYEIVHAHGTIHVHDDESYVRSVVARLTRKHEASQPKPWKMGDAPADYMTEQLRNIIGIEIRLTRLEGKRKLNQHHQAADREGAISGLASVGNEGLAQAMRDAAKPPP
jgi:transcriptional regulator